ncbi:putative centrosomal protein [Apostichopus japonicus]|uniref:Centrosomal protein kizuna n=1 Tax=Stichopus japonicus TaxID=307972 RepID=A0A2G8JK76_STIJA|nr:putative centrosomal protein [Apostichopus japonicus]
MCVCSTKQNIVSFSRAGKLQAYWKQLCEQEKISRARNQKLLQEFDRVETHVAALAVRTDRLRVVQEQYKQQVDQKYPNWRQNYLDKIRHKEQSTRQLDLNQDGRSKTYGEERQHIQMYPTHEQFTTRPSFTPQEQLNPLPVSPLILPTPSHQNPSHVLEPDLDLPLDYNEQRLVETNNLSSKASGAFEITDPRRNGDGVPHAYQQSTAVQGSLPHSYHTGFAGQGGTSETNKKGAGVQGGFTHTNNREAEFKGDIPHSYQGEMSDQGGMPPSNQGRTGMQGGKPHTNQEAIPDTKQRETAAVQGSMGYELPISQGTVAHRQIFGSPSHQQGRRSSEQGGYVSSRTEPFSSASGEDSQEEEQEEEEEDDSDFTTDEAVGVQRQAKLQREEEIPPSESPRQVQNETGKSKPLAGNTSPTASKHGTAPVETSLPTAAAEPEALSGGLKEDSDEDFESDLSLPLSDRNEARASPIHEPDTPELTTNGYLHLLQGLENIITKSDQHVDVYDNEVPSPNQKSCIIEDANSKLPMDTYDSASMSSVLLQELPLLVQASPRGYLISDQVLKSDRPILEVTIRSAITTNALPYWDRTLKHMVFLIKRGYFEPEEIAEKVAPLMVSKDSTMAEKAVRVVTNLLEDAVEEPTLDDSSLTQTSLDETPAATALVSRLESNGREEDKVPPLNLDATGEMKGSSDEEDNDSFFDQDVPLKETDAYKQMLQGMQPKSGRLEEREEAEISNPTKDAASLLAELEESSSEDEDEIEKAAMVTPPTSGRSSGGRPKRNVLSSLGGSDMFGQLEKDAEKKESGMKSLTPRDRSGDMSSPEKSDIISSASETPRETGGYVPSAIDNSLKSSGRKSDALQRSSAFWGEDSDLDEVESEMDVPMGTGGVEDDKDDFDFYD